MQVALAELMLLAVPGGVLGTWIVLRRLAFFTHAAGTATFPGLVVASATGVSPQAAGAAVALGYAAGVERAGRGARDPGGEATGLLLVVALATGALLASDVVGAGAAVDGMLFGSLLAVGGAELAVAAVAAAVAAGGAAVLGRGWSAIAFDPEGARPLVGRVRALDAALLGLVALCVVAALPAVGALLVTALFVAPAATALLVCDTIPRALAAAVAIAALDGAGGLYLAYWLDAPPGAAVAVVAAGVYGLVALGQGSARAAGRRRAGAVGSPR